MHKIRYIVITAVISLALLSCKSKSLFPEFKIGMNEDEWKRTKRDTSKVSSKNNYNWNIGESSIPVTLFLNPDGISHGSLRVISGYLSSPDGIDTAAKFQQIRDSEDEENGDKWVDETCRAEKFQSVLRFLKSNFGEPDSVIFKTKGKGEITMAETYAALKEGANSALSRRNDSISRLAGIDTLLSTYYFHTALSKILLIGDALKEPSKVIPFPHHNVAEVHEISNNYEKELSSVIESRKKSLTPKDVVVIPVYTKWSAEYDEYGTLEKRLYLTAVVDHPYNQRPAREENRTIRGVKGRIIITDTYGDSLFTFPDFKIDLVDVLPLVKPPGLSYIFNNGGDSGLMVYNETRKSVFLRVEHRDFPEKLRRTYQSKEKLSTKFVPEAIQFTDGSVLK